MMRLIQVVTIVKNTIVRVGVDQFQLECLLPALLGIIAISVNLFRL